MSAITQKFKTESDATEFLLVWLNNNLPSVIIHCWLGGRKGIGPVKNWVVGCWHGYLSGARCRLAYGPADATATHPLASVKSRSVLTFWYRLTRAVPDKRPINGCVCVIKWQSSVRISKAIKTNNAKNSAKKQVLVVHSDMYVSASSWYITFFGFHFTVDFLLKLQIHIYTILQS